MQTYIKSLIEGKDLTKQEAREAMNQIMSGQATEAQIGAYLTALRIKGETVEEITGSALVMREKSGKVIPTGDVLDIVGTGGDGLHTFNVSTVASLVAAAAGAKVAKHGNRSVSSQCGSADVLEALGVKIDLQPEQNTQLLEEIGICFMFAPVYHQSMKYAAKPRKELGIRSIFNILGPLSSPAQANLQLLGVYDESLVEMLAKVLQNLGVKRAVVAHGHDGLDEISLTAPTTICEVKEEGLRKRVITPEDFGFTRYNLEDLKGGDATQNAQITKAILQGEQSPKREMVILNAAAALMTVYPTCSLEECVRLATKTIDTGKAMHKLEEFIHKSNAIA
jgi:anthranilate phosphoribosyltransferase